MAVIEVARTALRSPARVTVESEIDVRLDVHDASRLEWSVSIPLPYRGQATYAIDVELEIPANVFATHLPWDQLQSWTRLDSAGPGPGRGGTPSIDALRRGAVAFAHKLSRGSEGFARHCRLAGAVSATAFTPASLEEGLELWLAFAVATAAEARTHLARPGARDALEIARERKLVDEYVSVRLLEMLASAERAIAALRDSRGPNLARYDVPLARIEAKLAEALEIEVSHRDEEQWLHPEPGAPSSLEAYIERASRLKKHFQEVLFLEAQTYKVAERLHNWVAAFVALVASTWAFIWQITLMNHKPTGTTTVGSGLLVLAMIAGAVYAVKDRIKELGRTWISGNVHRFYAQRVATWRAPAKRLPRRDVVVRAKESFDQCVVRRPDPLSPDSGATMPATQVHYRHRGTVHSKKELLASGVRRVKHIFRYDLSPLFARLDDPVKLVPVLDGATRRV
ncbi:MAG TPA: hypothetical protein VHS09_11510, partial [Polyangiaceae bacterium]|nr:hypothetical protein [Polyangiaceae bacterium]